VKGDVSRILPRLRREITAVDPSVTISEELPLRRLLENMYADVALAMRVLTYAGGLGLLLTAIGLYGALALAVGQRTREIGIRMALGARVPWILSLVLREGMGIASIGIAVGLVAAALLTPALARFLYGTATSDPTPYVAAAVLSGGIALAACSLPAWRAARIDPFVALRGE
jgi:putative ABC transport system permease protein